MPLSGITVNVGSVGVGRRANNRDKVSGIIFFIANGSLPAGFSTTAREKKVYSLADAEALGIASGSANFSVHWYHISEYFRMNPDGELWIGYYPVQVTFAYPELATFVTNTNGECRQIAIYNADNARAFGTADVTAIQAVIDGLDVSLRQFVVLFAPDFSGITAVTGWGTIADLRTLTAKKVSVVIAQSGSGTGLALATSKAYSITAVGTALGCVSKSSVSQSIGNPANFPLSNGVEMETLALANDDLLSALSLGTLGALKDKGYLIARKYLPDYSGSFFERQGVAIVATSVFAWLEVNRTMDKAIRNVRSAYTPYLVGQIFLKADGTLSDDSVGFWKDIGQAVLDQMVSDKDISAGLCTIDPTQNILSTSNLKVSIAIVINGIVEQLTANINIVAKIG